MGVHSGLDGHVCIHVYVHFTSSIFLKSLDESHSIGYFPRLALLLPLAVTLGIILGTDPALKQADPDETADVDSIHTVPPPPPIQTGEGSVDWLANVQAIQNLMGFL